MTSAFGQMSANEIMKTVLGTSMKETIMFLKGLTREEPKLFAHDPIKKIFITTIETNDYHIDLYLTDSCYQGGIHFKDQAEYDQLFKSVYNTCRLGNKEEPRFYFCKTGRELMYSFDEHNHTVVVFDRLLLITQAQNQ
ncbi:MAG: hypothetical protein JST75_14955 [Bacteroidetes bacterium]|nr:hypothetical protein [Bacteroidota bacterium]